jgi:hypothetical protein
MKTTTAISLTIAAAMLQSCAIGSGFSCTSATAAWSLKANEANCLSAEGERHIIQEVKAQLAREKGE